MNLWPVEHFFHLEVPQSDEKSVQLVKGFIRKVVTSYKLHILVFGLCSIFCFRNKQTKILLID